MARSRDAFLVYCGGDDAGGGGDGCVTGGGDCGAAREDDGRPTRVCSANSVSCTLNPKLNPEIMKPYCIILVPSLILGLRVVQGLRVVPVFLYRYSMHFSPEKARSPGTTEGGRSD